MRAFGLLADWPRSVWSELRPVPSGGNGPGVVKVDLGRAKAAGVKTGAGVKATGAVKPRGEGSL